jgi:hypothetical protein
MRHYVGLIHKGITATACLFPTSQALSRPARASDEARELAEQALAFHLEGLIEDGKTVPEHSSIEKLTADKDHRALAVILIQ